MRRLVVAELHDHLGEIGFPRLDPSRSKRLVEPNFLGRQRFDLDDLGACMRIDKIADDPVAFFSVTRPMDDAAVTHDGCLELKQVVGKVPQGFILDGFSGGA